MLSAGWFFRGDGPTDSENRVGNASRGLAMKTSNRSVMPKIKYINTHAFGLTEAPVICVKRFGPNMPLEHERERNLRYRPCRADRDQLKFGPTRARVDCW